MALQSWDKDNNKEWKVASDWIKNNTILLPFIPKDYEDDERYGDGPEEEGRGMHAISPKDKRKAFDKFVIDWRKQNGLEGTKVMPPTEAIPFWIRAKGERDDMTIAGGQYRMDKEGNAEVWKFGPKNYHYNPMPKSYYDLIESVKGMNFKKAELPSSQTIRDMIAPLTKGKGYDKESGSRDPSIPTNVWINRLKQPLG